jgi:hypothetical protein
MHLRRIVRPQEVLAAEPGLQPSLDSGNVPVEGVGSFPLQVYCETHPGAGE